MLETAASPTPAGMPGTWPAARKTIGTTPDIPAPEAGEAGDRGHGRGGQETQPEADRGDAAAGAHDGLGAEAIDQPVAEDRARGSW